jgi:fructose-1,6-bisphosphatase/inositol monophosphatase family enzyme
MNQDYKMFAVDLAYRAGEIIKKNFVLGMRKDWKSDGTPVTETDLVINQLVINSVKKEFPNHGILSEEGSNYSKNNEFVWVCDPIDGTIPFSAAIPTCVFSLALVCKGESNLGVIYDPFMDRLFFSEKGKGAFLNGKRISVSKAETLERSIVGISFLKGAKFDLCQLYTALIDEGAFNLGVLSSIYMGSLVASGELIASVGPAVKPHDAAALKIIVEEAGGKVTDIFGNNQRYDLDINGCLVSNGIVHDKLVMIIRNTVSV